MDHDRLGVRSRTINALSSPNVPSWRSRAKPLVLRGARQYDGQRKLVSLLDRKVGGFFASCPSLPLLLERKLPPGPVAASLGRHSNHLPRFARRLKHRINSVSRYTVVDGFPPPDLPLLACVSQTNRLFRRQPNKVVQLHPDCRRPYRLQHCSQDTGSVADAGISCLPRGAFWSW